MGLTQHDWCPYSRRETPGKGETRREKTARRWQQRLEQRICQVGNVEERQQEPAVWGGRAGSPQQPPEGTSPTSALISDFHLQNCGTRSFRCVSASPFTALCYSSQNQLPRSARVGCWPRCPKRGPGLSNSLTFSPNPLPRQSFPVLFTFP